MTEKLKQTIQEEVSKLPQEAQDAINSFGWAKIAEGIGKKFLLDEEEINNFQLETLLVLIGAVDPEFYAWNIENQVETTKSAAEKMAAEAIQKIFSPIGALIEENIKKSIKIKNPSAEQTLNFILSGGDYLALIAPANPLRLEKEGVGGGNSFQSPPRSDFGRSTPPPQGGEDKPTPIPKKMTDLRSQFKV